MKPPTACAQCRASKRKCRQPQAKEACLQCARSSLDCSLKRNQQSLRRSAAPLAPACPDEDDDEETDGWPPLPISDVFAEALVEEYVRRIHDRPHSIFHLPTLHTAVRQKKLKPALLYALLSLGARFHPETETSALAAWFFEGSKRLLYPDFDRPCLENIQTCILLAYLSAGSMKASAEAVYLSIAVRMAQILKLGISNSAEPIAEQELKRRIWWSPYMSDRWCAAGNGIKRQMTDLDRTVDLPIDEDVFRNLHPQQMTLAARPAPGLWAYMITLIETFGPIQDLNRRVAYQNLDTRFIEEEVLSVVETLRAWEEGLPASMRCNEENLVTYREKGLGGPFVALHLGFFHYSTLLYYQFLDVHRVATSRTKLFAARCQSYATKQSEFLEMEGALGSREALYPGIGHQIVISSSVLLHTLLSEEEGEVDSIRSHLKSNFEVLEQLRRYWPSLELTVRRLTVFQETCLQYAASSAYKFDNWMVKFLLEYRLPLDKEPLDDADDGFRYY